MVYYVMWNTGTAWTKNFVKKGSVKHTRLSVVLVKKINLTGCNYLISQPYLNTQVVTFLYIDLTLRLGLNVVVLKI